MERNERLEGILAAYEPAVSADNLAPSKMLEDIKFLCRVLRDQPVDFFCSRCGGTYPDLETVRHHPGCPDWQNDVVVTK